MIAGIHQTGRGLTLSPPLLLRPRPGKTGVVGFRTCWLKESSAGVPCCAGTEITLPTPTIDLLDKCFLALVLALS